MLIRNELICFIDNDSCHFMHFHFFHINKFNNSSSCSNNNLRTLLQLLDLLLNIGTSNKGTTYYICTFRPLFYLIKNLHDKFTGWSQDDNLNAVLCFIKLLNGWK